MRRYLSVVALAGLFVLPSGCVLMDSAKELGRQTKKTFTFNPGGYRDVTEEETNDWTDAVGREGRANEPLEEDPDKWWVNLFMSEKARSIERNVGIGRQ